MRLEKSFHVESTRDAVVETLCSDETLIGLFPKSRSEVIASEGDQRTLRSHYEVLGREGVATFNFMFLMDGNIRFEKICDGRVWRELRGEVRVEEAPNGARIEIEMHGRTKSLVPEFTIKGPMEDQIEEMSRALRELFAKR